MNSRIAATWGGPRGSTAEGDFHSACTFAAVYNAPVILNVINNQWAISKGFSGFAGAERTTFAARGLGYGIAALRVDGNDALACFAAAQLGRQPCASANHGPTLIEYFTYRAEGHSTSDDPSGYRSAQERERKCRPAGRSGHAFLKNHLIAIGEMGRGAPRRDGSGMCRTGQDDHQGGREERHPRTRVALTRSTPMFEDVYEELPWHLEGTGRSGRSGERIAKFGTERPFG